MQKPNGMLLTPGAGGSSEHATLQAIEQAWQPEQRRTSITIA